MQVTFISWVFDLWYLKNNFKKSSQSRYDKHSNVKNLWWTYWQTTRSNFSVMIRKWKVLFRKEKKQCVSCLKKNDHQNLKNYRSFLYCLFQAKYLKGYCMTVWLRFSPRIVWYRNSSRALNQVILVLISSSQLCIKSTNLLMTFMRFDLCSHTCPKLL